LAARIDAALKLSVIASLLIASSGVAYYYVVYLPDRDAQFDSDSLEKIRAYGQLRAEQERTAAQQQQLQQRQAEKAAAEERYQSCLTRASASHDASWAAQCNSFAEKATADHAECLARSNMPRGYCDAVYRTRDASPNCTLPLKIATDLDGNLTAARNRCLQERNAALQ